MGQRTAQSATVDVLTAEVRVLMVGSRQVTMSVFKQLDDIPHLEIKPFGRVNAHDQYTPTGTNIIVVGSDEGGQLAKACFQCWNSTVGRDTRNYYYDSEPPEEGSARRHFLARQGYLCTSDEWERAEALPLIVLAGLR